MVATAARPLPLAPPVTGTAAGEDLPPFRIPASHFLVALGVAGGRKHRSGAGVAIPRAWCVAVPRNRGDRARLHARVAGHLRLRRALSAFPRGTGSPAQEPQAGDTGARASHAGYGAAGGGAWAVDSGVHRRRLGIRRDSPWSMELECRKPHRARATLAPHRCPCDGRLCGTLAHAGPRGCAGSAMHSAGGWWRASRSSQRMCNSPPWALAACW